MSGLELLPILAVVVFFWLLVIRPQSRRQRELRSMQDSLTVGDAVVLTSGIFGTIVRNDDDRVGVEIAEGVAITVAKGAIGIVDPPAVPADDVPHSLDTTDPTRHPHLVDPDHPADHADVSAPEEKN